MCTYLFFSNYIAYKNNNELINTIKVSNLAIQWGTRIMETSVTDADVQTNVKKILRNTVHGLINFNFIGSHYPAKDKM